MANLNLKIPGKEKKEFNINALEVDEDMSTLVRGFIKKFNTNPHEALVFIGLNK